MAAAVAAVDSMDDAFETESWAESTSEAPAEVAAEATAELHELARSAGVAVVADIAGQCKRADPSTFAGSATRMHSARRSL